MPRVFHLFSSTALAACLSATAALADLTAAEVWADWQSYMASAGYSVTASEAAGSGSITVSSMTMTMEVEDDADNGVFEVVLDTVTFVEQGDGSVAIELPDTSNLNMKFLKTDTDDFVEIAVGFDQMSPSLVATGEPNDLTYTYAAEAASMALRNVTIDGEPIDAGQARFDVTMTGLAQVVKTAVGDLRTMTQDTSIASIAYDIAYDHPHTEEELQLQGTMQNLEFEGSGGLPLETDMQNLNAMLNDGFNAVGSFKTSGGAYDMSFSSEDGSGTVNANSTGAAFDVSLGPDGLLYEISQSGVNMNMLLTEFPLPLSFSAAEIGTRFLMPLQKSNDEQDFGIAVTLNDFAMSDVIWSLFDPEAQLPRDPATVLVDLSGKAKVLFDFLDPAQAAILEQADAAPGELNALTINALELDALGTRLTGSGDFVFDNSDLTSFDGLPRPEGSVDLTLVGGNGLIDKLVGMGLLPEDQAMGARMMMGLFAVPGDAEDTLNSKIEVNDQGHVLANGQRIR